MRITYKHARLERIIYEWDEADIRRALCKAHNIPDYQPGRRYEFEIDAGDQDTALTATLTVIIEREEPTAEGEQVSA